MTSCAEVSRLPPMVVNDTVFAFVAEVVAVVASAYLLGEVLAHLLAWVVL